MKKKDLEEDDEDLDEDEDDEEELEDLQCSLIILFYFLLTIN